MCVNSYFYCDEPSFCVFSLTKPEIFTELLHLIVDQPSEDVDDTLKYK